MNSTSNIWWIGPLVLTVLRLLYVEARLSHAASDGGVLIFRSSLGLRLLLLVGIVGFSAGTLLSIGKEETWLLVIGAMLGMAACFVWPATIILDGSAIRSKVWWRSSTALPWNQVSAIEKNMGGDLQVFGTQGQHITFTRFHVDPDRFQEEVTRRAGLSGVTKAGGPPSLRI
jgi:hypothetical protein